MFSVTGPVMRRPSAWRGDATNWIPKRPRSNTTVLSTFTSASHPLHPPGLTVGVGDGATALVKAGDERFQHCGPLLEVMPAVRQVEALVAERKVGDLLIAQGHGEPHPVVEGGIDDLVAREMSLVVRRRDMADLSAPTLDEADDQRIRPERPDGHAGGAVRKRSELLPDEGRRALHLEPADVGARKHVARVPRGNGDLRKAEDAGGEIVTDVRMHPAGTAHEPDQSQVMAELRRQPSGALESRLDRGFIPEELDGAGHVTHRLPEPFQ